MNYEPYSDVDKNELIVRDYLAADRTVLANERTFMAYVRTALAFAAGGASLIHFLASVAADVIGWVLIVLAVITMTWGTRRFTVTRARISQVFKH